MTYMTAQEMEKVLGLIQELNTFDTDVSPNFNVKAYDSNGENLGEVRIANGEYVFFPPDPDPNPF